MLPKNKFVVGDASRTEENIEVSKFDWNILQQGNYTMEEAEF